MSCLEEQSPNIAEGVHVNRSDEDVGAGDQVHSPRIIFKNANSLSQNKLS